jgi:GH24 family phage-related lysozyme (muramidase)
MTRIAPGTTAPNQTSFDDLLASTTRAAADLTATASPTPSRSGAGGNDAVVDQPAPRHAGTQTRAAIDTHALLTELTRWEGCCSHMYVDTRGFVTTGIGNMLPNAEAAIALPWRHERTGLLATAAEIRAAFDHVHAQESGHGSNWYKQASDLVLPPNVTNDLAIRRLENEFLPGLNRLFPGFDSYPPPAQSALVDMAYNLGLGKLGKFERLIGACARGDFRAAADHCHRRSSRETRNTATRNLFLEAANLTASVRPYVRQVRS